MLLRVFQILVLLTHIVDVEMCKWHTYPHCEGWGSCSRSCGGGKRSRICRSCVLRKPRRFEENCNEHCRNGYSFYSGSCHCSSFRTGSCCQNCDTSYFISICVSGYKSCGGYPDSIKCTKCYDPYYPAGYGNGCKVCPTISHCTSRSCTTSSNAKCLKCEDNNRFFKRTTGDTKCERMCSFNNHFCWPGSCENDLTKNCICPKGFRRISTGSETSCQPAVPPKIETCDLLLIGPNGERQRAKSDSKSIACEFLSDMFGNYQPNLVLIDMMSTFVINIPNLTRPAFIHDEKFGITDTNVHIVKKRKNDLNKPLSTHSQLIDTKSSTEANKTYHSKEKIKITNSLVNGEALCVHYEAFGGGYLKSKDINSYYRTESAPVPYQKTKRLREICYRFDNAKPLHCKSINTCSIDPIVISDRVTRSNVHILSFEGWLDPIPVEGLPKQTSGIEKYKVTVNEVIASKGILKVDTKVVYTKAIDKNTTKVKLNLPSDKPRLYSLTLEVKDVADNLRQARRFMLYDNTSFIEKNQDKQFIVVSASSETNFSW